MGFFKDLLIRSEDGETEAMKTVAELSEKNKNYKEALKWYNKLNNHKKVEELQSKVKIEELLNRAELEEILARLEKEEV